MCSRCHPIYFSNLVASELSRVVKAFVQDGHGINALKRTTLTELEGLGARIALYRGPDSKESMNVSTFASLQT